jgi:TPR repeat protein
VRRLELDLWLAHAADAPAFARQADDVPAVQELHATLRGLGGMYHAGLGAPKDLPLAAYWFAAAALRGIGNAQADIGIMYWDGQGVPRDRERAAQWWRIGAAKGNARAAGKLKDNGYYWSYFRYVVLPELLRSFMPSSIAARQVLRAHNGRAEQSRVHARNTWTSG